jgi:hypothetical protein
MTATVTLPVSAGQAGLMNEVPDPEVPERARRRTYTAKYKRDVLAEYEAAPRSEKGAVLRREGLYSSLTSATRAPSPRWPSRLGRRRPTRRSRKPRGCVERSNG